MFIATIPNRNSPPAILLREGYREDGKVKTRTFANLTGLPPEKIEALKSLSQNPLAGQIRRPGPQPRICKHHAVQYFSMMYHGL